MMKRAIILIIAAVLPLFAFAQGLSFQAAKKGITTDADGRVETHFFSVRCQNRYDIVWQNTYAHNFHSIRDLREKLFELGDFKSLSILNDSTLTCNFYAHLDYSSLGFQRSNMPIALMNGDNVKGRVVVQFKSDRYRITIDRIYFPPGRTPSLSYQDMSIFFKADSAELAKAPFLQRALMFLDKTFQTLVDFRRDGYLKPDF